MAHTKNKTKFWRKMSSKQNGVRTGRRLRDAMRGITRDGVLTTVHQSLFKLAGIETPVYNKQMASMTIKSPVVEVKPTNEIEDAVIINEKEVTNAVI